jgi:hypothetical protein
MHKIKMSCPTCGGDVWECSPVWRETECRLERITSCIKCGREEIIALASKNLANREDKEECI